MARPSSASLSPPPYLLLIIPGNGSFSKIIFFLSSFINLFILFIYFWLCWDLVVARGLSLVVVRGLLIALTSLVAEHRL